MKVALFSLFIALTSIFSANQTFAQCTCSNLNTAEEAYNRADAVFVGKIIEIKKLASTDGEFIIKFEAKQTWKHDLRQFVVVKLARESGNISSQSEGFYRINAEWLLFANKDEEGRFEAFVHCCTKTKPLSTAVKGGIFKTFKAMGLKPKKIIDEL
jgi:hypothetical protein